ncbi:hypothetical protein [Micromonospora sp. ATCC 39149]|uniref:hypothetical protein n=1 Tax=Micromonospora sp. (strain ATCC 39149 / NRRL 15099 / SCC 1413) TaxID=219305 RepID=UPI0018DEA6A1|nr:hypothetical protein [Micromonospora sp. ATCC 39149]
MTTTSAPVSAGTAHWSSFIWRWQEATSTGVCGFGSVVPPTDGPPARSSRIPSSRL